MAKAPYSNKLNFITEDRERTALSSLDTSGKPWDSHRSMAGEVEEIYLSARIEWIQRYATRIHECSSVLEFGQVPDADGVVSLKFRKAFFCRVRHCPVCQWRRSMKWQSRFLEAMPEIEAEYPKAKWIFATFTVKNCAITELRETITRMNQAFVRLSKRKEWPGKGWVKCVEVTRSADGAAHPHIHALIMVKPSYFTGQYYLKHEEWRDLWRNAARLDYDPQVNVRAVKENGRKGGIQAAIAETLKYTVKPDDMTKDAPWLWELTEQLYKTRAVSVGGVLRAFMRDDDPEPEEEQDVENQGGQFFQWEPGRRKYYRRENQQD